MTNLTDACSGCPGRCCTRRFWGRVHLTNEERRNPIFKGKLGLGSDGEIFLTMGKSACHFLNRKTGRCGIYEDRPMACREFVCHANDSRHVNEVIHSFPALRRHLKRKRLLPEPLPEECFFYVDPPAPGDVSVWHLREFRGRQGVDIGRYSARDNRYEIIGWFDSQGLFHRRKI